MKPMSVLAVASIAVLAVACRKDEPVTSETNTTSAPYVYDQRPAVAPTNEGTTTTGSSTDVGNTQGGGAQSGTTQTTTTTSGTMQKGKDGGAAMSDVPTGGSDLMDRNVNRGSSTVPAELGTQNTKTGERDRSGTTDTTGIHRGNLPTGTGSHAPERK